MKATIFRGTFFVKSLTFILYCSIVMHYWHFMISYCDKWNFSVSYCTILSLGSIGKYFAIVKWKVICQISPILNLDLKLINLLLIVSFICNGIMPANLYINSMFCVLINQYQCDQIGWFFADWATFGGLLLFFWKEEVAQNKGDFGGYFLYKQIYYIFT